jgi:predicted DNA-binding transcriptional regulator YafY
MQSDATASRKVDPYHLLFEGGQFYLVGYSHERGDVRVFRLSRIRGKVGYATKAEHDFQRPADFDPRKYAARVPWQLGETTGTAEVWVSDEVSWYVERQFGAYGELHDNQFTTAYANPRLLISWALGLREHARVDGPPELADEARERIDRIIELHRGEPSAVTPARPAAAPDAEPQARTRSAEGTIRPERFARLVTLASVLIAAGRQNQRLAVDEVCQQLNMTPQELREDIAVLNVVNFGGGAYVIYAEMLPSGEIEVDPEPYSDTFDRPARLLPIEAKALVAAIDLLNLAQPELGSAREKVVDALGHDPVEEGLQITSPTVADEVAHTVERAVHDSRLLRFEYWSGEQRFSERRVEPYALFNGTEAWYVAAYDLDKDRLQHFRLDRIKRATALDERFERRENLNPIADVGGWPRTGTVEGSRIARVWIAPEQARWAREKRTVVAELEDGAVVVEYTFKGIDYLVKEILKEAGDAAVLEPAEAREAVLAAAERLLAPSS